MAIKEHLENSNVLLVVVTKEQYIAKMLEILKELEDSMDRVCYVCFTQPYATVIDLLKKNSINTEKFKFIDVLTNTVQQAQNTEGCTYVSGPSALTEISIAFSKMTENTKGSIIDSISTLLVYESENSVIRFTHSLMTKTRLAGLKTIFITMREDTKTNLIKDLHMFADRVVYLGSIEERISEIVREK
jgi:KaiC/GvpD/RAD55 family RecA-like ATPase